MSYWTEAMQDDCYSIAANGWQVLFDPISESHRTRRRVEKGWTCALIPKELVIQRCFPKMQTELNVLSTTLEELHGQKVNMEMEHNREGGILAELEKLNKQCLKARLKALKGKSSTECEKQVLTVYLKLIQDEAATKQNIKQAEADLDAALRAFYRDLEPETIKTLVVDGKWMATLENATHAELDRISQRLTQRLEELAERYERPLQGHNEEVKSLETTVYRHLEKMGFVM